MKTLLKLAVLALLIGGIYFLNKNHIAPDLVSVELYLKEIKAEVGNRYVFEKDTVTIVKYNLMDNTYNLSNGVEIEVRLLKNYKKVADGGSN